MSMQIRIAPRGAFKSNELCEMHTLRAKVFRGRLGWEVPVLSGMEIDGYDALEPRYMQMREGETLRGCWRLLPTEGPYMLKDSFPQLLDGQEAPSDPQMTSAAFACPERFYTHVQSSIALLIPLTTLMVMVKPHAAVECAWGNT